MPARIRHLRTILASINEQLQQNDLRPEARAYLDHPLLGSRLRECAEAALGVADRSAAEIFGAPDDLKLRSSATLFAGVSPEGSVFHRILDKYFDGEPDEKTLRLTGIDL